MTDRRAHAWGAAIVAVGGLLGASAALWAGRPGTLWRPLAIGLAAYVASGALVLRWGLEVYGARGALASLTLAAFTPAVLAALGAPPLIAPAGGTTLLGGFAQLAAAYVLMRCLLDPTLQWALLAGLAILVAPIGAFLHGASATVMIALAVLSASLIVCRSLTTERWEARRRVAQASIVAVGLAWSVALLAALLIAAAAHLPSLEEYSGTPSPKAVEQAHGVIRRQPLRHAAALATIAVGVDEPSPRPAPWPEVLPLAALALAAVRPWRAQRRYSDAGWVAALLCPGAVLWLAWGEPGGVFLTPLAALLAGACWDASRPAWARQGAALVVALQVVAAVLLWPHYPGGVRSDAWLPMPGISMSGAAEAP